MQHQGLGMAMNAQKPSSTVKACPLPCWQVDSLSPPASRIAGLSPTEAVRFCKTVLEYIQLNKTARIDWGVIGAFFNMDFSTAHAVWRMLAYEWTGKIEGMSKMYTKVLDNPSELEDTIGAPPRSDSWPVTRHIIPQRPERPAADTENDAAVPKRKRWLTSEDRVLFKGIYLALGNPEAFNTVLFTVFGTIEESRRSVKPIVESIDMNAIFRKHFTDGSGRTASQLSARLAFIRRKAVSSKTFPAAICSLQSYDEFLKLLPNIPDVVTALKLPGQTHTDGPAPQAASQPPQAAAPPPPAPTPVAVAVAAPTPAVIPAPVQTVPMSGVGYQMGLGGGMAGPSYGTGNPPQ